MPTRGVTSLARGGAAIEASLYTGVSACMCSINRTVSVIQYAFRAVIHQISCSLAG